MISVNQWMSYTSNVMTMIQLSKQNILCCVGCASVELSGIATKLCAATHKCTKPVNYKTCCHCLTFMVKFKSIRSTSKYSPFYNVLMQRWTTTVKQHIKTPWTDLTVPHGCKLLSSTSALTVRKCNKLLTPVSYCKRLVSEIKVHLKGHMWGIMGISITLVWHWWKISQC